MRYTAKQRVVLNLLTDALTQASCRAEYMTSHGNELGFATADLMVIADVTDDLARIKERLDSIKD